MSVEKVQRKDGPRYVVWWKDELRRTRNRTFRRKADAETFDAKIKLAKRTGDLAQLDAGKETLAEFFQEWNRLYGKRSLSVKTLGEYTRYLEKDILPALGHLPLRRITPLAVQNFVTRLQDDGRGDGAIRKLLTILQGVLQRAVEWQRIQTNPVKAVTKPSGKTRRKAHAISPAEVELLRTNLTEMRDAALVSVLAYQGLRPGEALALTWGDLAERTLRITKSLSLGEVKETKTGKDRTVPLRSVVAQDLNEWRLASGRPDDDQPIFPAGDGGYWEDHDYRNWRKRIFKPAVEALEIQCPRPYDLRHSHASLRFAEGVNPAEIAEEMGHSLETLLNTYTHVIKTLAGQGRVSGDELIREARRGHILVTRDQQSDESGDSM